MNSKLNILIITGCIGVLAFVAQPAKAQCDDKLIDKVIEKSGTDALFMRDFYLKPPTKSKKKKDKSPTTASKYEVRLNKGIVYRFIIENEENSKAQAFLQLRKNNLLLANTYDVENQTNIGNFDFFCDESGPYKIMLSYTGESTGCAAAAMFALIRDSSTLASIVDSNEIHHVLYTGIDNFIDIAASDIPGGSLEVSISRGTISKEGGLYKIRVEEPGKIVVEVIARDKNGKINETFKSEFLVMAPVLPSISFLRSTGGMIKKADILNSNQALEIHNSGNNLIYKIKTFEISAKLSTPGIPNSGDNRLNFRQLNLIKELKPGDTFYIINIEIEDPNGKIYRPEPLGFIIIE